MKFYFIAILLFLNSFSYPQDKPEKDKKEEFVIPANKTALNDLLEETKQRIIEADQKAKYLQSYSQNLSNYKTQITNLDSLKLNLIYDAIGSSIVSKNLEDIYFQEENLTDFLRMFSFYFRLPSSTSQLSFEGLNVNDFYAKVNETIKSIQANELIRTISNNHDNDNNKPVVTDIDKLSKLKLFLNGSTISELKTKIIPLIDNEITLNKNSILNAQTELQNIKSNRSKILDKLNQQETQINDLAIKLGLPLFCLTILALFLVPNLINRNRLDQTQQDSSQNVLLEISTVLLLTMSILILGLSDKIHSDVLGTLIGGISGYVLNRIRTRNDAATAPPK